MLLVENFVWLLEKNALFILSLLAMEVRFSIPAQPQRLRRRRKLTRLAALLFSRYSKINVLSQTVQVLIGWEYVSESNRRRSSRRPARRSLRSSRIRWASPSRWSETGG